MKKTISGKTLNNLDKEKKEKKKKKKKKKKKNGRKEDERNDGVESEAGRDGFW